MFPPLYGRSLTGLLGVLSLFGLLCAPVRAAEVRFPGDDTRWDFVVAVLDLALAKSARPDEVDRIIRLPSQMQTRRLSELEAGRADVIPLFASRHPPASTAQVIPLPLTRGLLGWRLLLVRESLSERLSRVGSVAELRAYRLGFLPAFADFELMQATGFNISSVGRYESLFKMLEAGRLDWLSRSVMEVYQEEQALREHGVRGLVIQPDLALHYPADWLFAVGAHRPGLRERLERGLRLALEDGSYQRLFEANFGATLKTLDNGSRRVLEIANPEFPPLPPGVPPDWLWKPRGAARR